VSTVKIGLTGPIGCGKSTIAGWLAGRGAVVIDADAVARAVVEPGEPALGRIVERFGAAYRSPDGSLDRAALGRLVFADPAALRDLEAIVHPAVRPRILAAIEAAEAEGAAAVVVEAIKLVEGGLADLCDEVWLVDCPDAVQRERLRVRGLEDAEIERRVASQAGLRDVVRPVATRLLETGTPRDETRSRVEAALAAASAAASARA
jgi:dephospho-CoA kinase